MLQKEEMETKIKNHVEIILGNLRKQMLHTKVPFGRWHLKCKEVIWIGWKRINEDGQMGEESINRKTPFNNFTH